ncbi:MAG: Uma2 family endonuclease [Armatimonadaceae bacterium]
MSVTAPQSRSAENAAALPLSYPHQDPVFRVGQMSYTEFIAFDRGAEEGKQELIRGKVFRMPGATMNHNRITLDASLAFIHALTSANKPGEVFADGQKVFVNEQSVFYPDVMVVFGETRADAHDALLNPAVILEVLSDSTAAFDRGEKFEYYPQITSLQHYILVEQNRVSATHFQKIAGNLWAIVGQHNSLADTLNVAMDDAELPIPLSVLYRRIPFSPASAPDPSEG